MIVRLRRASSNYHPTEHEAGVECKKGFSPLVTAHSEDWPLQTCISGYWYLDEEYSTLSAELEQFLESGERPVCVTFGSEVGVNTSRLIQAAIKAVRLAGHRVLVVAGWSDEEDIASDQDVFVVRTAPYGQLFRRVSCVVHHCGTGTVAEVLRAGIPSVCIPFHGEQRYWALRLHELGVATQPLSPSTCDVADVQSAVEIATSIGAMSMAAKKLGLQLRETDGVTIAIEHLHRFVALDERTDQE